MRMNRIHKCVRLVYISSIVLIPLNVLGFNIVYLYACFSGRYEQCWDCTLLKNWSLALAWNVVVSVLAIALDVTFEKFANRAKSCKRHKGND